MKNNLLRIIFIIIIHSVLFAYGMDPVPILDNQMIVWKIILEHGVRWFDYRKVQSLVVSKTHDKLLRDTAECRKKYLNKELHLGNEKLTLVWHKYGAMCGSVTLREHQLCRRRFHLQNSNRLYLQPIALWSGRCYTLPHRPQPFFDKHSAFCFYGYGKCKNMSKEGGLVIKYIWNDSYDQKICSTNFKNEQEELIGLTIFLEFPVLLKAFLKSRKVYEEKINWWTYDCDVARIYDIKGVTIPKNYRQHKQYFSSVIYASFDDLPEVVRKAVEARYKEQRKKK